MHKYYFTEMSELIPYTRLYDESLKIPPGLTQEEVKDKTYALTAKLQRKGKLLNNVIYALEDMQTKDSSGKRLYMLAPVNMILWVYELGNTEPESVKLFDTIAKNVRVLYRSKCKRYEKQRIPLKDMPISRRFKERLGYNGAFKKEHNRKFLQLQALLTAMCCAVRGHINEPHDITHEIIRDAAPGTLEAINAPIIDGAPRNAYSAIYSTRNIFWNIALLRTGEATEMQFLMKSLLWRADARMEKVDSKRTTTINRLDFYIKLLSYMELSASPDSIICMDHENMAGSRKLW